MYARTSFRGAKMEKRVCFWSYDEFWKDMTDKLKKNTCKNAYLGSIFIPEKYVFRVCFESPFTRMISNPKYKWPPRGHFQTDLDVEIQKPNYCCCVAPDNWKHVKLKKRVSMKFRCQGPVNSLLPQHDQVP